MNIKRFLWIPVVITILAALFATKLPDGLDFVAGKLDFAGKGIERAALLGNSPLASIIGVLIIFGIFWLAVKILKTTRRK